LTKKTKTKIKTQNKSNLQKTQKMNCFVINESNPIKLKGINHHQRPPEFGRGGAHLPFGFNLAQFKGL